MKFVDDTVAEAYLRSASPWVVDVSWKVPEAGMPSDASRSCGGSFAGGVDVSDSPSQSAWLAAVAAAPAEEEPAAASGAAAAEEAPAGAAGAVRAAAEETAAEEVAGVTGAEEEPAAAEEAAGAADTWLCNSA